MCRAVEPGFESVAAGGAAERGALKRVPLSRSTIMSPGAKLLDASWRPQSTLLFAPRDAMLLADSWVTAHSAPPVGNMYDSRQAAIDTFEQSIAHGIALVAPRCRISRAPRCARLTACRATGRGFVSSRCCQARGGNSASRPPPGRNPDALLFMAAIGKTVIHTASFECIIWRGLLVRKSGGVGA